MLMVIIGREVEDVSEIIWSLRGPVGRSLKTQVDV